MKKLTKFYDSSSSLVSGIILIVLGIIIFIGNDELYIKAVKLIISCIFVVGIIQTIRYFLHKDKRKESFSLALMNLVFVTVVSLFPELPLSIVPLLFALYFIINAIIKLVCYGVLRQNNASGIVKEFVSFLFFAALGIAVLLQPIKRINIVLMIAAIYFIALGTRYIFDFSSRMLTPKYKKGLKRKIRIGLPVLLQAIIPYAVLKDINSYLSTENEVPSYSKIKDQDNVEVAIDMEVFIHAAPSGFNRMGHIDLLFDDQVISYGNYDNTSLRLFDSVGDGVLFFTKKEKYIPFCIKRSNKTIISFGLRLTSEQKESVRACINGLKQELIPWKSLYQKSKNDEYNDYASALYKATKAKFYKFKKKSKFKTYFVLGYNCCLLADNIIGKTGIDILNINGLITPGTYYEYLNQKFIKGNDMVVSKEIYNKQNTIL